MLNGNRIPEVTSAQRRRWLVFALIALVGVLLLIALPPLFSTYHAHQRAEQARQHAGEKFQELVIQLKEIDPYPRPDR
jgi:type II secretory pathway component PulL